MSKRRPYVSREFGELAQLLFKRWPGIFRAEGDGFKLDRLVCHEMRVLVWMDRHPTTLPGKAGWRVYMAPARFDEEITVRCVAKDLRRAARARFGGGRGGR